MKDYLIIGILFACGLMALKRPIYGLYGWFLVSFLNIHRLGWGLAVSIQPGLLMGAATFAGLVFHPQGRFKFTKESAFVFLFWLFTLVSTYLAQYPDLAWETWIQYSKMVLFFFITIYLVTNREDLKKIIIVATVCFAFYGTKGGIWSILTGGRYRVWGPDRSFIADNNELALALNMTLPMIWWLAYETKNPKIKMLWLAVFSFNILAVIFTFSRGGFLTLILVGLLLIRNSKKKVAIMALVSCIVILSSFYISNEWIERMQTISSYEEEASARSRLTSWKVAWAYAKENPLFGSGFEGMSRDVYQSYGIDDDKVAHSIYLGTLAEQGFVGLAIYLLIYITSFKTISNYQGKTEDQNLVNLLKMIQISLLAFLFGGLFYERQYFDYTLFFISLVCIVKLIIEQDLDLRQQTAIESTLTMGPGRVYSG